MTNYVVATFEHRATALAVCRAINDYGQWDAVVALVAGGHEVLLPGECVPGTEEYMRGFVEGFMYLYKETP